MVLINDKTYYTTVEIAKMLGKTRQTIFYWIKHNPCKLPATMIGGRLLVSEEDYIDNVPAYMRIKHDKEEINS
jgi:excisionase family DNA binding protein